MRNLFDRIKAYHGEGVPLNVFPVLPASAAVETGRVWMPKADLSMKIYDQHRTAQAFIPTIHRPSTILGMDQDTFRMMFSH